MDAKRPPYLVTAAESLRSFETAREELLRSLEEVEEQLRLGEELKDSIRETLSHTSAPASGQITPKKRSPRQDKPATTEKNKNKDLSNVETEEGVPSESESAPQETKQDNAEQSTPSKAPELFGDDDFMIDL